MEGSRLLHKLSIILSFFGLTQIVQIKNQYKTDKCRTFYSIFVALCVFLHGPGQMYLNTSWRNLDTAQKAALLAWTIGNGTSLSIIVINLIAKQRKVQQFYTKIDSSMENIEQLFGQKILVNVQKFLISLGVYFLAINAIDSLTFHPVYILQHMCMLYHLILVAYFAILGFVLCAMYEKIRKSSRNILEIKKAASGIEKTTKNSTKQVTDLFWPPYGESIYSVRGLERSELGGSYGCPGHLWDLFL